MTLKAVIQTGTNITIGITGSPTIAFGTGAPSGSTKTGVTGSAAGTPVTGSQYIRTDGTSGARIYWYYSSWVAQSTP